MNSIIDFLKNHYKLILITLFYYVLLFLLINREEVYKKSTEIVDNKHFIESVAKVINKECSYCPITDKILIGSSIVNRMNHPDFPCAYEDVIENQYATSDTFDLDSYKVAEMIINDSLLDNRVLYFYNPKIATDKRFMRLMEKHTLLVKTKYHNYYD